MCGTIILSSKPLPVLVLGAITNKLNHIIQCRNVKFFFKIYTDGVPQYDRNARGYTSKACLVQYEIR